MAQTPEQITRAKFTYAESHTPEGDLFERARDIGYLNCIPKPPKSEMGIGGYKQRLNNWINQLKEMEWQQRAERDRVSDPHTMITQL